MGSSSASSEDAIIGFKRFARGIWYYDPRSQESKSTASDEDDTQLVNDDSPRYVLNLNAHLFVKVLLDDPNYQIIRVILVFGWSTSLFS